MVVKCVVDVGASRIVILPWEGYFSRKRVLDGGEHGSEADYDL